MSIEIHPFMQYPGYQRIPILQDLIEDNMPTNRILPITIPDISIGLP